MTSLVPFAGRKKAPCVSQDAMVGAMMTSLISDLEKAYNGQECIHGLQEFLKHGSIPKNAIQNNRLLLKSLMAINYECIFKRSDIKAALVELDCKLQYKISNGYQCHGWADDWASFIHVCIMDVKKSFRNCKNFARVSAWLMELYDILKTSHKNMSPTERSTSQSSSCLGDQTTPCATKRRCLVYRKSQSPDKEEQEEESTLDDSFHFDPKHDMAIKVSGVGKILQSKKYKQLPCGARVYLFGDGSTWEINPHTLEFMHFRMIKAEGNALKLRDSLRMMSKVMDKVMKRLMTWGMKKVRKRRPHPNSQNQQVPRVRARARARSRWPTNSRRQGRARARAGSCSPMSPRSMPRIATKPRRGTVNTAGSGTRSFTRRRRRGAQMRLPRLLLARQPLHIARRSLDDREMLGVAWENVRWWLGT